MYQKLDFRRNKKKIYIVLFVLNIVVITLFASLNIMAERFINHNKHMVYSITNIKYIVTQSHLWLEEYLIGDKSEYLKIDLYLSNAKKELKTLKNGGEIRGLNFNSSHNNDITIKYLETITLKLDDYGKFIEKRVQKKSKTGTVVDEEFDDEFTKLIKLLEEFDSYINSRFLNKYEKYQTLKAYIFVFISLLILFGIYLLVRFNKDLEDSFQVIKEQADELIIINEKLEEEVKQRTEINIRDKEKIYHQEKLLSMNELIKNIAHHWRQPLSYISTIASSIKLGINKEDIDKQMSMIISKTNELSNNIEYFRGVTNDTSKKKTTTLGSISTVLKNIIGIVLNEANITYDIRLNNKDYKFELEENRLISILISFISNSKEILEEREIDNKKIIFEGDIQNKNLIIKIKDNAGGIEEDVINRIFEPYFTTHHQSLNKGLTLYVSYEEIKNRYNGTLFVKNGEEGAIFTIKIPIT